MYFGTKIGIYLLVHWFRLLQFLRQMARHRKLRLQCCTRLQNPLLGPQWLHHCLPLQHKGPLRRRSKKYISVMVLWHVVWPEASLGSTLELLFWTQVEMNIANCRLTGLASRPQLPPLIIQSMGDMGDSVSVLFGETKTCYNGWWYTHALSVDCT